MKVKVLVSPKVGVLDPQAKAIFHTLHSHGFTQLESVKLSREITFEFNGLDREQAMKTAQRMCETLLVNPIIEDYSIEIDI